MQPVGNQEPEHNQPVRRTGCLGALFIITTSLFILIFLADNILPKSYEVQRSVLIREPADQVYPLVDDVARWKEWNPWQNETPDTKSSLGELTKGTGSKVTWDSSSGSGHVLLTNITPIIVGHELRFQDQWKAEGEIQFQRRGEGTDVTWVVRGRVEIPLVGCLIALGMDSSLGAKMDEGLKALKAAAEK